MLIFETSCTNRSVYNEFENVICAKKLFIGKWIETIFGQKIK